MEDFLLDLITIRNCINRGGWLVIPPVKNYTLTLRVEWYLDKKYSFESEFSTKTILDSDNNYIIDEFIHFANREIDILCPLKS
jgi:hypothetical protein